MFADDALRLFLLFLEVSRSRISHLYNFFTSDDIADLFIGRDCGGCFQRIFWILVFLQVFAVLLSLTAAVCGNIV